MSIHTDHKMFAQIKDQTDGFFKEKNVVTDTLGKLEEKTGIQKQYIALGKFSYWKLAGIWHEQTWKLLSSYVILDLGYAKSA